MFKKIISLISFVLVLSSCTGLATNKLDPETEKFLTEPLQTEFGENVPIDSFALKETEDFKIIKSGFNLVENGVVALIFQVVIKDPSLEIEYVKVESVVPNNVLTFIDESLKGRDSNHKNPDPNVITASNIKYKEARKIWSGVAIDIPTVLFAPEYFNKYLFKFTIKPVGKPETIIYQPCLLQLVILGKKTNA